MHGLSIFSNVHINKFHCTTSIIPICKCYACITTKSTYNLLKVNPYVYDHEVN